jgi:hypothetical protein
MKKLLLILCAIGLIPIISFGQTSSNSCAEADGMSSISANVEYNVASFDGDAPSPNCLSGSASNGEWFKYTPSADYFVYVTSELTQNHFIDEDNPSKDTRVHIYSGACEGLVCLAADDNNGYQETSRVGFSVEANETYYIAWDNLWDSRSFDFKLIELDPDFLTSFSSVDFNAASGRNRGLVDMNGDFLDDVLSISTVEPITITINYQQLDGSFIKESYPIMDAIYTPEWGVSVGDYDRNGYNDFLYGDRLGAHVVKANDTGDDYSIAATSSTVFTQRSNFVDFDNDGNLDIFICDDTAPNEYFINDGTNLTLWESDDPNAPIVEGLGLYPSGGNYGSVWIDYDSDGDSDLFIAKCGGTTERKKNQLFRNNGNLSFTEVSVSANMDDPINAWSSAWGDYDSDGDMDAYVGTSISSEQGKLMQNDSGVFTDVTLEAALNVFEGNGWDDQPFDFNNDGFIDVFTNGSILFNNGDATFTISNNIISTPLGGAVGDFNNDGFLDVLSGFDDKIYTNNGNGNNWLKLNLIGTTSNINGIGARIEVSSPSFNNGSAKKAQIRDVRSGEGFLFMSSLNPHFGLGTDDTIDAVTVYWPSGTIDIILNPAVNTTIQITEGETLSTATTLINDLILYPNPTKRLLNLNSSYGFQNAIYSVFDMTGRRVLNSKLNSKTIDVSELSTGNYILRIIDNGVIKTQKFIKQ